jgi:hypothetical protein
LVQAAGPLDFYGFYRFDFGQAERLRLSDFDVSTTYGIFGAPSFIALRKCLTLG